MTIVAVDDALLDLSERALIEMRFETRRALLQGISCVLAENAHFILAVAAAGSVEDLRDIDEAISLQFAGEVAGAGVAGKQWDVYLVLLTSATLPASQGELIHRLAYNTHYLRRLVRTKVVASLEGVRAAFRPFDSMPELSLTDAVTEPLDELSAALPAHGVDPELARRAIATFRATGEASDA